MLSSIAGPPERGPPSFVFRNLLCAFPQSLVLAAKPEHEILAHNRFQDRSTFNASPIVAGGKLVLRSDRYLYCVGEKASL